MKELVANFLILLLSSLFLSGNASTLDTTRSIDIRQGTFHDVVRKRDVPYKVYSPESLATTHPVIIFSHGLVGSINAASYLGEHLARNGFVSFHIQHHGSDMTVWKGEAKGRRAAIALLKKSTRNPFNVVNRYEDVSFVVNQLTGLNRSDSRFKGHLDLDRLGMAGHSFGAGTTQRAAGQLVGLGGLSVEKVKRMLTYGKIVSPTEVSFKEPRIKAAMMLSPNLPRFNYNPATVFEDIDIPLFHLTGTQDTSPIDKNLEPAVRARLFCEIKNPIPQYLIILDQADHAVFSGNRLGKKRVKPSDLRHIEIIRNAAVLFFKGHLLNDEKAVEYLRFEFPNTLHPKDHFEWKQ